VLQGLAGLMRRYSRKDDVVARYGGEEFCSYLVETDRDGAMQACERVRSAAEASAFDIGKDQPLQLTVSLGFASFPEDGDSAEELIGHADLGLYAAKHGGRNQVVGYTPGLSMPAGGVESDRTE
jgi:diguanylate cyclase (GGDEF)-like protein